jgi:acetyl-CoA carboxylase biotin carboxyl carrier protein
LKSLQAEILGFELDIPSAFKYQSSLLDLTNARKPKINSKAKLSILREEAMSKEVVAPMPGTIIDILVNVGDEVLEYQEVLILEAMKMENAIPSAEAGTVKEIKVQVNDKVATNQVLMVLE